MSPDRLDQHPLRSESNSRRTMLRDARIDNAQVLKSSPVGEMDSAAAAAAAAATDSASLHLGGPSTYALDEEAQQRLDEQQPFINHPPGPTRAGLKLGRTGRRPHSRPYWKLAIFFFIVALSVVVLSAVPFWIQAPPSKPPAAAPSPPPASTPPEEHGHENNPPADNTDHQEEETEHHNPKPPAPAVVHYDESLPTIPKLRDVSQYVLAPSWNLNAAPTTREYHWTIADARLNPDGVYRPMILINNQFPGPLVECNDGDTIVVHVENKAANATSIHFHGLFQNGTNTMDGAIGITQCPIAPNSTFTYTFTIQHQSGTYWYHAHHSAQASDGLLGPVVIHSQHEHTLQELEYATDRVVMVQDHYHNLTSELLMEYLKPDMENNEPVPDNGLINGRGVRDCKDFEGWDCDARNASTPVFDLAAGQRHRLRIINVGAFAEFQIQFDEHPFYITEVDGTDVHPEPFHRLNILPAQRYSIIIDTNVTTTTTNTFWMRARMVTHCFTTKNPRLQPETRAIIRYISPETKALDKDPTSKDWPESIEVICRDLNVSALHPVVPVNPPPADTYIRLEASFMIGDWRLSRGFFNESTWHHNVSSPSLHRFLDASANTNTNTNTTSLPSPIAINNLTFTPKSELVIQTQGIRTIDFSINNFDDGSHPFHLHGHKFFVLLQGRHGYPPSAAAFPPYLKQHNLDINPLRRDTVTVEGYGWAIVRVVLDNPGMWALHCHNMWHAESGMLMQLLVRSEVVSGWEVSQEERAMCAREGASLGARPDDDIWFGSFDK